MPKTITQKILLVIIVIASVLFLVAQFNYWEKRKNESEEKTASYKQEKKSFPLKKSLNYEGVLTSSLSLDGTQIYILTDGDCSSYSNDFKILDAFEYYNFDVDGNIIPNNKGLFPFGKDKLIPKYSFCIETKNGVTTLYTETEFERAFSHQEAIPAMESLIDAVNKSKFGEEIQKRNLNENSWKKE